MSPRKIQADIDTPLVRELVAAQFPQWAGLPLEPVDSSGLVNAIYRLGTDLSVRLPRRPSTADIVQREQAKLTTLARFLPVAIPSVEAIGSPTEAYPGVWSVHRWLAGTHPSSDTLVDPRGLAMDLAAFVDAFRRIDLPDRTPTYLGERRTRAPMVSMDSSTREAIGELDGLIDTRAALASWEESLAAPYDRREVWVHSDLTPGNLLVSADGRLTAVRDFETCGVGDPACDVFPAWHLLPANLHDEFRATLDVDDATWLRGRVLSQVATALAWSRTPVVLIKASDLKDNAGSIPYQLGYPCVSGRADAAATSQVPAVRAGGCTKPECYGVGAGV